MGYKMMENNEIIKAINDNLGKMVEVVVNKPKRVSVIYRGVLSEIDEQKRYFTLKEVKFGSSNPSTEVSSVEIFYSNSKFEFSPPNSLIFIFYQ